MDQLVREVKAAFDNYDSLPELSRSPLACADLIAPALVLDAADPTADDQGRALRVALRWAVGRLAPAPPPYPLGVHRPLDDPTWRDPLWRRYNILRHCYLEPLRPDDVMEWHGLTNNLVDLMGFPPGSRNDRFYGERDRAIRDVARLIYSQLEQRQGNEELRWLAVEELYQALKSHSAARHMLGLASTFRREFPRALLADMAAQEQKPRVEPALRYLMAQRLLQSGDGGTWLCVPPPVQAHVHARQSRDNRVRRHRQAAWFYEKRDQPIETAWHLQQSKQTEKAADVLLRTAHSLMDDPGPEALREALLSLNLRRLPRAQRCQAQILLCDLWRKTGERKRAQEVGLRALKTASNSLQRARIYRRLGKLDEEHYQLQALHYYKQANQLFPPQHPGRLALLKDRAWLYIHRQEWEQAEGDLQAALALLGEAKEDTPLVVWRERANIFDALSYLYGQQAQHQRALSYAEQALALREQRHDQRRVADSWNNIGIIYYKMGQLGDSRTAYELALATFRELGNQEAVADAQLNIGGVLYDEKRFHEAIERYEISLQVFRELELFRAQAQALYNLAEAFAALEQGEQAQEHWQDGYKLSQEQGLRDQIEWFESLRDQTPSLPDSSSAAPPPQPDANQAPPPPLDLSPREQTALEIARREGQVTTRLLMNHAHVARAQARRVLSKLVKRGLLVRKGKGPATFYVLPKT